MQITNYHNATLYDLNHEAQEIWRITQPELTAAELEAIRIFRNTRVSNIFGEHLGKDLPIWEDTYGIIPDLIVDTDEERRERVLERKRDQPPFTVPWMHFELAKRFPDGDVAANIAYRSLFLELLIDISGGAFNEKGFVNRRKRELLPWFRGWIPTNLLLIQKKMSTSYFDKKWLYVGGKVFPQSKRYIQRKSLTPNTNFTKHVAGAMFRQGTRTLRRVV